MSFVAGLMDEVEFMDTSIDEAAAHPVYGPYPTFEEAKSVARTLSTDPNEGVVMEVRWLAPVVELHKPDCLCDECFTRKYLDRRPGETRREYRKRMEDQRAHWAYGSGPGTLAGDDDL